MLSIGLSGAVIRGVILSLILLYASCTDCRTRECPDFVHVMILITGFIGYEPGDLPDMLLGLLLVGGFQLAGALITHAAVNGADLKLSAACAFVLGTERGIIGLILGLLLSVTVNLIRRKGRGDGFPLLPYLSAGFLAAYFL